MVYVTYILCNVHSPLRNCHYQYTFCYPVIIIRFRDSENLRKRHGLPLASFLKWISLARYLRGNPTHRVALLRRHWGTALYPWGS